MSNNNKKEFKVNELVLGQLRGYPWWPAFISSICKNGDYKVIFFPDFSYSQLNAKKIKQFNPKIKTSDKKNIDLNNAIGCAMRIHTGQRSIIEEHNAFLKTLPPAPPIKPSKNSLIKEKELSQKKNDKKSGSQSKRKQIQAKKKKIIKPKPKITKKESNNKKVLEIINSKKNLFNIESSHNMNQVQTVQSLKANKSEYNYLKKNECCSVWSKHSDKDNFQSLKETRSYKEQVCFKESVNKSTVDNYQTEENSEFYLLNMTNQNCRNNLEMEYLMNPFSKRKFQDKLNLSFFDCNFPNTSNTFISKQLDEDLITQEKNNCQNKDQIFLEIENEMKKFALDITNSTSHNDLENKLFEWYKIMEKRPNFKLILDTNIGKYLSLIKDFCKKKIEESQIYDQISQLILECQEIIYQKIHFNFFGDQKPISITNPNNIISKQIHILPQKSLSLKSLKMLSSKNSFEMPMALTFQKKSFDESKSKINRTISFPQMKQITNKHINATPDLNIELKKDLKKTRTNWNVNTKVNTSMRSSIRYRISHSLYNNQIIHLMSNNQSKQLGIVIEKLIGSYSTSFAHYQKMIVFLIKEIKKNKNNFIQKLILNENKNYLSLASLKIVLEDFFDI